MLGRYVENNKYKYLFSKCVFFLISCISVNIIGNIIVKLSIL